MENKQIVWESQHLEIDTKNNTIKYNEEIPADLQEDDMSIIPPLNEEQLSITPFGIFRVDDDMNPLKQFKLWMAHTNFSITKEVAKIIGKISGVELLRVISRYRFIIGIGRAFDSLSVKQDIEKEVCGKDNPYNMLSCIQHESVKNRASMVLDFLQQYKGWSLLIFPNGNMEFVIDTDPHFKSISNLYARVQEITNGILIQR